jgi:intracellular sulfur oxidation DsrE/DsrF family protein
MKIALRVLSVLLILLISNVTVLAQQAKYPMVKEFGGIYEIPNSINPDSELDYKIVIDLKTFQQDKESINSGLNNVARMMNLHGLGGVKPENLNVAVVVHGGATESILNHAAYQQKNGVNNPNINLIKALKEGGAELYVCGQSLLARGYAQNEVNADVKIGLSMLTVVTTHMHEGYKQLVFN